MLNASVAPVKEQLKARRGRTFQCKVTLYEDTARIKPLNLIGLTVTLTVDSYLVLTGGAGLTLNSATGEVTVTLTAAQTKGAPADELRYFLVVEEGATVVEPLAGPFIFENPGA